MSNIRLFISDRNKKKIVALFLTAVLIFITAVFNPGNEICSYAADYDTEYQVNLSVSVAGKEVQNVKTIHLYYDNNLYVSLRDMAALLSDTKVSFNPVITKSGINFYTGSSYTPLGTEGEEFTSLTRGKNDEEYVLKKNAFSVDGATVQYYTFLYPVGNDEYDCYMLLTDLVLLLDVDMHYEGEVLYIDPDKELTIDLRDLEDRDFFTGLNATLVGDATTGDIYYSYEGDSQVSIASTTKLMTYAVVMDAVSAGEISLSDTVTMSANVAKLSRSIDYGFYLTQGSTANVEDLLYAMLMPSSNEAALALAEYVSGSEKLFVGRMNQLAASLGMSEDTCFYNSNGLPTYTLDIFNSKVQNHMSAQDMFKLVCYIFAKYPQITDITSCTYKYLPTLGRTVYNSNNMLYNVKNTVGLKTGTTNRAGACLVSAIQLTGSDGDHMIVAIEYGACDSTTRNFVSKTLLTYGRGVFKAGGLSSIGDYSSPDIPDTYYEDLITSIKETIPDNPEDLAQLIVWTARNYIPAPIPDTTVSE